MTQGKRVREIRKSLCLTLEKFGEKQERDKSLDNETVGYYR